MSATGPDTGSSSAPNGGLGRAARMSRDASKGVVARIQRATHAKGAGESGLAKLIELNGAQAAGDALVAVALANTLFFAVPTDQARGRVALYLLITMAPFAVIAPVIGPVLDRFRHGRRYALATTMLARAIVAWFMASALAHHDPLGLYPGAFAILVLSKAFGISKSAVTPRLLPAGSTLVQANARVSLGGTFAGLAVGALGAAIVAGTDPKWALRLAAFVFAAGVIFALQLPPHADSSEGEKSLRTTLIVRRPDEDHLAGTAEPQQRLRLSDLFTVNRVGLGPAVLAALRANSALRYYTGFLSIFLAFLVREHDFGPPANIALGLFGISALGAGVVGTVIGARTRGRAPDALLLLGLVGVTTLTYVAGLLFSLVAVILVAIGAAMAQTLAKLALDATIQRDVDEEVRTAAFARTETVLQLSFVIGGAFGLIPFSGRIGLLGAAVFLTVVLMDALHRRSQVRRGRA